METSKSYASHYHQGHTFAVLRLGTNHIIGLSEATIVLICNYHMAIWMRYTYTHIHYSSHFLGSFDMYNEWSWWHIVLLMALVFVPQTLLPETRIKLYIGYAVLTLALIFSLSPDIFFKDNYAPIIVVIGLLLFLPITGWYLVQRQRKWSNWNLMIKGYDLHTNIEYAFFTPSVRVFTSSFFACSLEIRLKDLPFDDESGDQENTLIILQWTTPLENDLTSLSSWNDFLDDVSRMFSVHVGHDNEQCRRGSNVIKTTRTQSLLHSQRDFLRQKKYR